MTPIRNDVYIAVCQYYANTTKMLFEAYRRDANEEGLALLESSIKSWGEAQDMAYGQSAT